MRNRIDMPEQALVFGILQRAVMDVEIMVRALRRKPGLFRNYLFRNDARKLRAWFLSKRNSFGSYRYCCDVLSRNPEDGIEHLKTMLDSLNYNGQNK